MRDALLLMPGGDDLVFLTYDHMDPTTTHISPRLSRTAFCGCHSFGSHILRIQALLFIQFLLRDARPFRPLLPVSFTPPPLPDGPACLALACLLGPPSPSLPPLSPNAIIPGAAARGPSSSVPFNTSLSGRPSQLRALPRARRYGRPLQRSLPTSRPSTSPRSQQTTR